MVENIFHQKRWKNFSIKNDGKYFPVENVFRKADEFSLREGGDLWCLLNSVWYVIFGINHPFGKVTTKSWILNCSTKNQGIDPRLTSWKKLKISSDDQKLCSMTNWKNAYNWSTQIMTKLQILVNGMFMMHIIWKSPKMSH